MSLAGTPTRSGSALCFAVNICSSKVCDMQSTNFYTTSTDHVITCQAKHWSNRNAASWSLAELDMAINSAAWLVNFHHVTVSWRCDWLALVTWGTVANRNTGWQTRVILILTILIRLRGCRVCLMHYQIVYCRDILRSAVVLSIKSWHIPCLVQNSRFNRIQVLLLAFTRVLRCYYVNSNHYFTAALLHIFYWFLFPKKTNF